MRSYLPTVAASIITFTPVTAFSAPWLTASTYDVYGVFDEVFMSAGALPDNSLESAHLVIAGEVDTDTAHAGYNITGGYLTISGSMVFKPASGMQFSHYYTINGSGSVSNSGVIFDTGSLCIGFSQGDCSLGNRSLDLQPITMDGSGTWGGGYFTTKGLNLLGGVGGNTFSVAQPGFGDTLDFWDPEAKFLDAVGTMRSPFSSDEQGLFLRGDLNFVWQGNCTGPDEDCPRPDTYPDPSAVPLPMSLWLFGSALLGLFGIKRQRDS